MARRIGVIDHHESDSSKPRRFIKRSVGHNLVRRALAYWVVKNYVLKMLPTYAPEKIPVKPRQRGQSTYEHHLEPKLIRVQRWKEDLLNYSI